MSLLRLDFLFSPHIAKICFFNGAPRSFKRTACMWQNRTKNLKFIISFFVDKNELFCFHCTVSACISVIRIHCKIYENKYTIAEKIKCEKCPDLPKSPLYNFKIKDTVFIIVCLGQVEVNAVPRDEMCNK